MRQERSAGDSWELSGSLHLKHQSRYQTRPRRTQLLHDLKENGSPLRDGGSRSAGSGVFPAMAKTLVPALYKRHDDLGATIVRPADRKHPDRGCVWPRPKPRKWWSPEQRALIWKALRDQLGLHGSQVEGRVRGGPAGDGRWMTTPRWTHTDRCRQGSRAVLPEQLGCSSMIYASTTALTAARLRVRITLYRLHARRAGADRRDRLCA